MIALLGGLLALMLAWWIARRLILLALLVGLAAFAGRWLTHTRLLKDRAPGSPQLHRVQREITHEVTGVLRRDGVIHRRHPSAG